MPLYLWVDVAKIESAVQNLLSNAFKYTSQNGRIELAVSEAEIDHSHLQKRISHPANNLLYIRF